MGAALRPLILIFGLVCLLGPLRASAATQTVALPVTLDYPFIRSVLIYQAYTQPGQRAVAVDKDEGCTRIELWAPEVDREGSLVRVRTRIKVKAGLSVLGRCLDPLDWRGYVEVLQRVWLDKATWEVRFKTVDSRLYDQRGQKTTVANVIWNLIKTYVHAYLDQVTINLAPPVKEVRDILPLLVAPEDRQRIEVWLNTLRPGPVRVEEKAVRADILMEVEKRAPAEPSEEAEGVLSEPELAAFARAWEAWDAFLVNQILSLRGQPLTEEERTIILEALLETRHGFVRALSQKKQGRDLVRVQFLETWRRLAPLLRRHLVAEPSPSLLSYLAFFTALDVLDKLGPTLGLDISREGLYRLVSLLYQGQSTPLLEYSFALDPDLRRLLGLGPPLIESGPRLDVEGRPWPASSGRRGGSSVGRWWSNFLNPSAWAAAVDEEMPTELKKWLPPRRDIGPYLDRLQGVLREAADLVLARGRLEEVHHPLFRRLVPATAWQESCWRQFVVMDGRIRYLRSYNNSSVGLMQINERVWRGVYRLEGLRSNIRYNALAGTEILELYLRRYALERLDSSEHLPEDVLAQAVYAMYNGGPSQFEKFLKRRQKGSLHLSDRLFEEKYAWVKDGRYDRLSLCLLGE